VAVVVLVAIGAVVAPLSGGPSTPVAGDTDHPSRRITSVMTSRSGGTDAGP